MSRTASQLGKYKRSKGAAAERELFGLLSEHLGFVVRRNVDQARNGGADGIEIPGWAIEVKRQEQWESRWWIQALEQAEESGRMPALCYRASRQPWRVRLWLANVTTVLTGVSGLLPHETDAWCEVDLPTFAMIVRESLPAQKQEDA